MKTDIDKLLNIASAVWLTKIDRDTAKNILKEHPNIFESYKAQHTLWNENRLKQLKHGIKYGI